MPSESLSKAREIASSELPDLDRRASQAAARLIDLVLEVFPDAEHARKWGRLTFTRNGDWHHWICAITPGKGVVKLTLHKGALLSDPTEAMEGNGKYIRQIPCESEDEVEPDVIAPILREAADRQTER